MIQTPHVVAIDDDAELLKLLAMLLRRVGAQTTTFSYGNTALEHLAAHVPDLILLDLMLPEPNGVEILRRVRSDARLARVPILILSAKADARSMQQALELGADGFISKPYVASSLIERVKTALVQRRTPPGVPPPNSGALDAPPPTQPAADAPPLSP